MVLSGELEIFNLVDILQILNKDSKSGVLVIDAGDKKYALYFKGGDLVLIRDVDKVFYVYLETNFDAILNKCGVDVSSLSDYTTQKLPELKDLKVGKFSFTPDFVKFPKNTIKTIPAEKVILYLSRYLTPEEAERKISDEKLIFQKNKNWEERAEKAELDEEEQRVLKSVDGKKKVEDIKSSLNIDDLKLKQSLYGLLAADIIKRAKRKKKLGFNITKKLLNKIKQVIKGL